MERTNCVVCGADDATILFQGQDHLHGGPGSFPVCRCQRCDSLYLNPRPKAEELGQYYPDRYAPYTLGKHPSAWQNWNLQYAAWKLVRSVLARVREPGRALDVGCATGEFLVTLQQKGWQVQGVEMNPQAAAYAQDRVQGEILIGDFMESAYPDHTFDLVTFWDVLEHLPKPRQALAEAARITRPSGFLVLSLPNLNSLEARLFGTHWAGWDIPRHLWWSRPPALAQLLAETGWALQELTCMRGRHWMLTLSLHLWLKERSASAILGQAMEKVIGSPPVRILLWPYFVMVETMGLGSILAVFAKRREDWCTCESVREGHGQPLAYLRGGPQSRKGIHRR